MTDHNIPFASKPADLRAEDLLDSWKEIAAYLGKEVRTVQRWEKKEGLPVHRQIHEKLGTVYAYKSEIDAWWKERSVRLASRPENGEPSAGPRIVSWPAAAPNATDQQFTSTSSRSVGHIAIYAAAIAACAAAILFALYEFGHVRGWLFGVTSLVKPTYKQITFLGNAYSPGISPDGNYVAYVAKKHGEDDRLIVQAQNGTTLEVARGEDLRDPRWSPDGSELLYFRNEAPKVRGIFVVSPLGGASRQVVSANYACWLEPDGSQVVGGKQAGGNGFYGVKVVNKLTGESRDIPLPAYHWLWDLDCAPRTGKILVLTSTSDRYEIHVFNRDGSGLLKLAEERETIHAARWSTSGDAVYYLHGTGGTNTLSKVSAEERSPRPSVLATGLPTGGFFSVSSDGKRFIYTRVESSSNLWRVKWRDSDNPIKPAISQLTSGTFSHAEPAYSPDGQWIAFRRGPDFNTANIFKMRSAGGPPTQVTFFERGVAVSPAWSPAGEQIAFDRYEEGVLAKIATVSAAGGDLKILQKTDTSDASGYLAWWPSSDIVYQQSGNRNFLEMKQDTGQEIPILRNAERGWVANRLFLSADGKNVAVYWNRRDAGLWIISRDPYLETLLKPGLFYPIGWSPDGKFVYAIKKPNGRQIVRIEVANPHTETLVADLPGPTYGVDDAAVSPNASEIIVSVSEEKSDVWSTENFDQAAMPMAKRTN